MSQLTSLASYFVLKSNPCSVLVVDDTKLEIIQVIGTIMGGVLFFLIFSNILFDNKAVMFATTGNTVNDRYINIKPFVLTKADCAIK